MNKTKLIQELAKQTGYNIEKCTAINNVLESHFLVGRKNKEKIIKDLQQKVALSEDEAENGYDIAMKIIMGEMKNQLKHPFKSQDS